MLQRDVYKDPLTDEEKRSKKGYLTLERGDDGSFVTIQEGRGDKAKVGFGSVLEYGQVSRNVIPAFLRIVHA